MRSYARTSSNLGKTSPEADKPKSYTRTYSSLGADRSKEDEKEKQKSYTRSYTTLGRSKLAEPKEAEKKSPSPPKRVSSRYGSARDLSNDTKTRLGSARDLSVETKSRLASSFAAPKKEEKKPPVTFNTRYKVTTTRPSRDPSPAVEQQTVLQRLTAQRDQSRESSPANRTTPIYSRGSTGTRSRDPSPVSRSYTDSNAQASSYLNSSKDKINELANQIAKSYSSSNPALSTRDRLERTYSSKLSTRGDKSRDPSPVAVSRRPSITSITSNSSSYPRSRDPSPVDSKYSLSPFRATNGRDPSPSITLALPKTREQSPISVISNRLLSSREASPANLKNRLGTTSTGFSSSSSLKSPDISISYMTASESNARPTRASFINRHSPQKEKLPSPPKTEPVPRQPIQIDSDTTTESSSEEEDESVEEEVKPPEPVIMIQVTTITRGTSPTPPSSSTPRVRRIEYAKMIEKVRQRPMQGPPVAEKATQSDRMDDSTRYSRFSTTSRISYSPYSPTPRNYSSSRSSVSTSSRYSREPSESVSTAESEKSEHSDRTENESKRSPSRNVLSPSKISVSKDRMSLASRVASSKSKTPESTKSLPPQCPPSPTKSESPKVVSKDFRKSALNMGPTSRVSRSKSSSSGNSSPTVEKTRLQFQKLLNGETPSHSPSPATVERQSSVDSDTSTDSVEHTIIEPTKEEIISQKVEEAKTFLLKTLGNSTAYNLMKSPTPSESITESTTNYPTQTATKLDLDFSKLQKNVSGEKPWWMDDTGETQESTTTQPEQVDETLKSTLNGFSEMTLNQDHEQANSDKSNKYSWLGDNRVNLNEKIERCASGEKAWWCRSPENKNMTSDNQAFAQIVDNARSNMWEQETQADVSEIQRDDEYFDNVKNGRVDTTATTLGDRVGPEGVEANQPMQSPRTHNAFTLEQLQDFNARPRLFISRHTNIDDLLGKPSADYHGI